jgi:hypothetical protein
MKKILTILVLVLIPVCIFAGEFVGFNIGVTGAYQKAALGEATEGKIDVKGIKWEDFKYGVEADFKLCFLDVNAKGFFARNADGDLVINGIASANLTTDIFFVRLKAGLGYQYSFNPKTNAIVFGHNANSFEDYENACFDIYTGVDLLLGPVVVGAYATLPTGVSIGANNWEDIISTVSDNWKSAQIGLSVGFSVF